MEGQLDEWMNIRHLHRIQTPIKKETMQPRKEKTVNVKCIDTNKEKDVFTEKGNKKCWKNTEKEKQFNYKLQDNSCVAGKNNKRERWMNKTEDHLL